MKKHFLMICLLVTAVSHAEIDEYAALNMPVMSQTNDLSFLYGGTNKNNLRDTSPDLPNKNLRVKIFPHTDNRAPHRRDNVLFYSRLVSLGNLALYDGEEIICTSREIQINLADDYTKTFYCFDENKIIPFNINAGVSLAKYRVSPLENHPTQVQRAGHDNNYFYRGDIEIFPYQNKIILVNIVDMETYLRGVVPGEIFVSWPSDTVSSQSVAARTYAYYHLTRMLQNPARIYHFDDTTSYQVYIGDYRIFKEKQYQRLLEKFAGLETGSTEHEDLAKVLEYLEEFIMPHLDRFFEAMERTKNQVMTVRKNGKNRIFQSYFHAASGGATVKAGDIAFSDCTPCAEVLDYTETEIEQDSFATKYLKPYEFWTRKKSLKQIETSLKRAGLLKSRDVMTSIIFPDGLNPYPNRSKYGHFTTMPLQLKNRSKTVKGYPFKSAIGLPNIKYDIEKNDDGTYIFKGRGYGHSTGLCQWGAYFKGKQNIFYEDILKHYYHGIHIVRL
ncbi:MAG: SpoIID/LytB domain-containing protein [Bacteriovoracaceae bacterium]|nr:SpoIID/LytB domain-containing protein [Bacteriovoracaceae bacterium]